jgi:hypothetical protein
MQAYEMGRPARHRSYRSYRDDDQPDKRRPTSGALGSRRTARPEPRALCGWIFSPVTAPSKAQRITQMQKSSKSRAAEQFTATQKKTKRIMTEIEKTRQERSDNMAKQRAQRLDKEAADKEAAEKIVAEKAAKS